mmetsp:Transcript_20845/g.51318  ORF Transcript_20845/g.51318 Transcript_20845/m.51318 type:complete len:208 (-) Transcript_20845:654-1277(-)
MLIGDSASIGLGFRPSDALRHHRRRSGSRPTLARAGRTLAQRPRGGLPQYSCHISELSRACLAPRMNPTPPSTPPPPDRGARERRARSRDGESGEPSAVDLERRGPGPGAPMPLGVGRAVTGGHAGGASASRSAQRQERGSTSTSLGRGPGLRRRGDQGTMAAHMMRLWHTVGLAEQVGGQNSNYRAHTPCAQEPRYLNLFRLRAWL